jgi:hypothetical protein
MKKEHVPGFRTDYCTKAPPGIKGHGYHEMTVTGYRCMKGRLQYEIQNSWGKTDIQSKGIIENVRQAGKPTGRFWVDEETLIDHTMRMTSLSEVGQ